MIDLEAIKQSHALPEVVGAVVKLQRAGREWKACCPLHNDRSPSFTIFDDGKRFQCFGCGASGDVLDFIGALHGVGLREAAEMLTGEELPKVQVAPLPPADDASDRVEEARSIWRAAGPVEGTPAESYLRWRGISIPAPLSVRYSVLPYGKRGRALPCLVCCVSSPEGPLQGKPKLNCRAVGRLCGRGLYEILGLVHDRVLVALGLGVEVHPDNIKRVGCCDYALPCCLQCGVGPALRLEGNRTMGQGERKCCPHCCGSGEQVAAVDGLTHAHALPAARSAAMARQTLGEGKAINCAGSISTKRAAFIAASASKMAWCPPERLTCRRDRRCSHLGLSHPLRTGSSHRAPACPRGCRLWRDRGLHGD
ncbi:hypothetical protein D2V04_15355 [Pelagerythrobacter aerophilus]|uniref:Zinc finger CHC2-type domain-containing protein n=1 Tax=Pelagerythrobacter aerophilus TaxID=2306995 RepID=A0A418NDN9_9SPHN|nr:hypothetical protein D2V04_15355 [Pelagerythrobacter aerophilus]